MLHSSEFVTPTIIGSIIRYVMNIFFIMRYLLKCCPVNERLYLA